jgi:hypothetical protein
MKKKTIIIISLIILLIVVYSFSYTTINPKIQNPMKDESCGIIKLDFENDTIKKCFSDFDINNIKKYLKKQNIIKATKYIISHRIINLENSCIGLYFVESENLKKHKLIASIPLLKFKNELTTNFNYENGILIENDSLSIINDIKRFKESYSDLFSQKDMNEIIRFYKYGIQYSPKNKIYIK